jgi:hypothetical protein
MNMPLRDVALDHETPIRDALAEKHRELINAYERIDDLEAALWGMLGLIQLLSHNRDIPETVRDGMLTNHRYLDAEELLR